MPTAQETLNYQRLRQDVGFEADDTDGFPDEECADIYAEAAEDYAGDLVIKYETRVIALQRVWIDSAKLTTYQQNNSLEKLEDVFTHLQKAIDFWTTKREKAEVKQIASSQPNLNPPSFNGSIVAGW